MGVRLLDRLLQIKRRLGDLWSLVTHSEIVLLLGGLVFMIFGTSIFSVDEFKTLNKTGTLVSVSGIHKYILGGGSIGLGAFLVWKCFFFKSE